MATGVWLALVSSPTYAVTRLDADSVNKALQKIIDGVNQRNFPQATQFYTPKTQFFYDNTLGHRYEPIAMPYANAMVLAMATFQNRYARFRVDAEPAKITVARSGTRAKARMNTVAIYGMGEQRYRITSRNHVVMAVVDGKIRILENHFNLISSETLSKSK